jgi:hypothetical protein
VELDWQPNEFFDDSKLYLICATHGALYSPADGRCLGGRCNGRGLTPLPIEERDGAIYHTPSEQELVTSPENEPHWERQLLEKLALATLQEQRAKRRWGIFFKLIGLSYLVAVLVLLVDWDDPETLDRWRAAYGGRSSQWHHLERR